MNVNWDVDDDGRTELPTLTSFAVAVLPQAMLAVQLRCALGDNPGGRSLQIAVDAECARELAAGLLEAADMMGGAPGVGRLN